MIEELTRKVALLQSRLDEQSSLLQHVTNDPDIEPIDNASHELNEFGVLVADKLSQAGITPSQCPLLCNLDLPAVASCLQKYNTMADQTPFSVLADITDVERQTRESTVFVLAAMLIGPDTDPDIAKELDFVFHRLLTDQAFVRGRQNLDLLRGLVTYLLWFHHRFDPAQQQFYQYLQLSKAMVDELELSKTLESMVAYRPELDAARLLSAVSYIDRGVGFLDFSRDRQRMPSRAFPGPTNMIGYGGDRAVDCLAPRIMNLLPQSGSFGTNTSTRLNTELLNDTNNNCINTLEYFSKAWRSLRSLVESPYRGASKQNILRTCYDCFHALVTVILDKSVVYLQIMTIVEWAYLLSSLVTLPHLEAAVGSDRQGNTIELVRSMRLYLQKGQQTNPRLLQQSKHLWWLELVAKDIEKGTRGEHQVLNVEELLETSPYELLEQLTQRWTGYRKSLEHDLPGNRGPDHPLQSENDVWPNVMAAWLNLEP